MTAMQLNAKKLDIIGMVMKTNDEKAVSRIWDVVREMEELIIDRISGLPSTDKECLDSLLSSMDDYRTTGVAFSMEQMRAKHPRV
jgi:hypothetical protein